ncbi:FABP family protein [Luteococcus sp. Sow4_B9]|uniref:FABP family protein n=1 Tax=Luteococcus sp. Sow4_B9 TaxID=3438792 RepID=UPI003F9757CE
MEPQTSPQTMTPPVAAESAIASLQPLVGTWRGEGHGEYPTISPFDYTEEVTFVDVGKPFLVYHQRTWGSDGRPMHVEVGYLRAPEPGVVELTMALPTGQTELGVGTVTLDPLRLELDCRVDNTPSAKQVEASRRVMVLTDDVLETRFDMAAVGQPLQPHLRSRLVRQAG